MIYKIIKLTYENIFYLLLKLLILFLPFYSLLRLFFDDNLFFSTLNYYFRDLTIFLIFILSLLCSVHYQKNLKIKITNITLSIFLLLLNYILAIVINLINGYTTLIIQSIHISIIPLFLYLAIAIKKDFVSSKLKYLNLINYIQNIVILVAIIGFLFYIFKFDFYIKYLAKHRFETLQWARTYIRMVGIFFQPNSYSSFLTIGFFILFVKYIFKKRIKYLLLLLFLLSAIILTFSRGAWMGVFISVSIVIFLRSNTYKLFRNFIRFLIITLILLFIFYLIDSNIYYYLNNRFVTLKLDGEAYNRINDWLIVLNSLLHKPLGHGIGIGSPITHSLNLEGNTIPVIDGFYIKTIAETGVIGLLIIFITITLTLTQLYNSLKLQKYKVFHYIVFSIYLSNIFQNIGSNVFDFINVSPLIWLLLGLSNNLYLIEKINQTS